MKKIIFLLVVGVMLLGNVFPLSAQILNGSFTNGFTDWNIVGGSSGEPQVVTSDATPPTGSTAALVQSTNEDQSLSISASAATLDAALGVTLPATYDGNILDPTYGQSFPAVNGQAIYQTFTLASEATLSFAYSYQTNDYYPYDATGYVLDGVYTPLVITPAYTGAVNSTPTAYAVIPPQPSLVLGAGSHTLAFVAYNTGGHSDSTSLYVTDVSTTAAVPEPSEWTLMLLACVGLILVRKLRRAFST